MSDVGDAAPDAKRARSPGRVSAAGARRASSVVEYPDAGSVMLASHGVVVS